MPKFAANLSFIFQEVEFLDRFAAAAQCGFKAVEYLGAYDRRPETVAAALERNGLVQALFNMPPGDWAAGERGIAALPGREAEFRAGVDTALHYAKATRCRLLHAMAGCAPGGIDRGEAERVYTANLRYAAERLAPEGITALIEPINNRDIPGYFLNTTSQAMAVIERVGHPNLQLQLDLYHVQIMEGDLAHRIRALAGRYPHIQIAGNPGRHEPDIGEINYRFLFDLLDEIGYAGWIGCEYRPKGQTRVGLGWAARYGIKG
jgi:hydroxypyruvate isomerase